MATSKVGPVTPSFLARSARVIVPIRTRLATSADTL
jgi:hypothetical protein